MIRDGDFHSQLPITGSHEPCGTVVEGGSEVKGFKKGDRIGTLPFMHPCGECPDCKFGSYVYCDKMEGAMGISTDGAFGEVSLLIGGADSFSTLSAIQSRASIYQIRSHSNMLRHCSVPGQPSTMQSKEQISKKAISSASSVSEPSVIWEFNSQNAWFSPLRVTSVEQIRI